MMMGERQVDQSALFYEFSLGRHVPVDHMLRAIDRFVDLGEVRPHLAPFYSATGRPSVDPELLIRMLIIGYCYGIRSERRLCEEVHLNLGYRWFCRLGLAGEVPDHSTFSKNRHGRFRASDLLRHVFETVVRRCIEENSRRRRRRRRRAGRGRSLGLADGDRRRRQPGARGLAAQGERVGWLDADDLFLDPESSFAAVQKLARDQGTSVPIKQRTLWKRLAEQGHLVSRDRARGTNTVRRTIGGRRLEVIHLKASTLAVETDQRDETDQEKGPESREFPGRGQFGQFGQKTEHRGRDERDLRDAVGWEVEI